MDTSLPEIPRFANPRKPRLMGNYTYEYPHPSVTVDVLVFSIVRGTIQLLLVKRKGEPFAGQWAIPGGFLEIDEAFEAAARRELREETGLELAGSIDFIGVFGKPGRDPRGRTISIAHAAVVRAPLPKIKGGDDASEAAWHAIDDVGPLAFDHSEILTAALYWLLDRVVSGRLGLDLLPKRFRQDDVTALLTALLDAPGAAEDWLAAALLDERIKRVRRPAGAFEATTVKQREATRYQMPFHTNVLGSGSPDDPEADE